MKIIGRIIWDQIKILDGNALYAWGAFEFMDAPNGLKFKVRTPIYPKGAFVEINLNSKDLYDVKVMTFENGVSKVVESVNDVFNDMLIEIIDDLIERDSKKSIVV